MRKIDDERRPSGRRFRLRPCPRRGRLSAAGRARACPPRAGRGERSRKPALREAEMRSRLWQRPDDGSAVEIAAAGLKAGGPPGGALAAPCETSGACCAAGSCSRGPFRGPAARPKCTVRLFHDGPSRPLRAPCMGGMRWDADARARARSPSPRGLVPFAGLCVHLVNKR